MAGVYALSAGGGSDMGPVQRAVRAQVSFWQGPRDDRPSERIQCAAVMLSYCRILHYGCTALLYCYQGARRHAWAWGGSVRWLGAWCWWLTQARRTCACDPQFSSARTLPPPPSSTQPAVQISKMYPCPRLRLIMGALYSDSLVAQNICYANPLEMGSTQEPGSLQVTAKH
jgi:hypothetical protein